ncbi:MAG: dTDP-glucose 4,6-dehydratase, dTDP-glucose 4,6-dehydratase [Candidatus Gottesmanbacteria bacterium GW2011_GWA2_43_14]|uniref:dTDP-glucose 4,6-dehydratase n=1 Tax=Candidatus Gottesmanbacteria bacterium GW2011_GWA2_43_14 TaxID=1618443 RepID=A0A0G1DM20_9BACT|nr:MAG: dTDP-glucose 4,6-dehydratase, dTDP-glucose 4,6-dehydratase [Candidatus Gottesmanbacteria bacterium GW2011_GWA2_43_14]
MNILVTGGAGFIGTNFIRYWLEKYSQDKIVNYDVLTYAGNPDSLADFEGSSRYRFIQGDINNRELVSEAMKDAEMVVHFAAETHVDRSIADPQVFLRTNVLGTQVLLEQAVKNKVGHFHHISTDEVYGTLSLAGRKKFNEDTRYRPRSPYAASKAASDHLVLAYYETYGLPVTITNCSNNYGPYQHPEKLIPLTITNLLEGLKVPVYGDGRNVRDWLYVDDHCRAIDLVLKKGQPGRVYCVGGLTSDISNLEVVKKILKLMDKDEKQLEFVKDRVGHDLKYALDWSRIKNELGWQPKADFDKRLRETVDWYLEHKSWWKKLKGRQFREYYRKQYQQ